MGTPAEKAHRARAAANRQRIVAAATGGKWTTDAQLSDYLQSIGLKANGPMYNQHYSGGGYSTYGPSWDPGHNYDFQANKRIAWQGKNPEQFPWYDPTVESNWNPTDPTQAARMNGFFNWRDQNLDQGLNIDQNYGGNAFVAWLRGRAGSNNLTAPDMSWTGQNWGNPGGAGYQGPTLGGLAGAEPPVVPPEETAPQAAGLTLGSLAKRPGAWNDWSRWGI